MNDIWDKLDAVWEHERLRNRMHILEVARSWKVTCRKEKWWSAPRPNREEPHRSCKTGPVRQAWAISTA